MNELTPDIVLTFIWTHIATIFSVVLLFALAYAAWQRDIIKAVLLFFSCVFTIVLGVM